MLLNADIVVLNRKNVIPENKKHLYISYSYYNDSHISKFNYMYMYNTSFPRTIKEMNFVIDKVRELISPTASIIQIIELAE